MRSDRQRSMDWRLSTTIAFVVLLAGCERNVYRAGSIPAEFIPPPQKSVQSLDLSNIFRSHADSGQIYIGDVLDVMVTTGAEERQPEPIPIRVAEDGSLNVPLVGKVRVAGLELSEAEDLVREASVARGVYRRPQVSLLVKTRRSNFVTVTGAVEKPGVYELPAAGSDLLAAIVAAGGFSKDASTEVEIRNPQSPATTIQVPRRDDPQVAGVSVEMPTKSGPTSLRVDLVSARIDDKRDYRVTDGAVVMVMKKPPQKIHVIGLVKKPDAFEIPADQEVRMLDAIALAGGRTLEVADKVHVIRHVPGRLEPVVIQLSIGNAKSGQDNIRLSAGDVVSVEETPVTFVVDAIRNILRFGFSAGVSGL